MSSVVEDPKLVLATVREGRKAPIILWDEGGNDKLEHRGQNV